MVEERRPTRFGFGPERRVLRRVEFEALLRKGSRRTISGFTFYLSRRPEGPARLGILMSRKHSPRATVRNALKRRIREAFRHQDHLGPVDLLVRPPYGVMPGRDMSRRIGEAFAGLTRC